MKALVIGTFGIDDVRDVSEAYTLPTSVTRSITGSKIVQIPSSLGYDTGETLSYSARMLSSDYEILKAELNSGGVKTISLYSDNTLISSHTGILTEISGKRLHPTDLVDAVVKIELI